MNLIKHVSTRYAVPKIKRKKSISFINLVSELTVRCGYRVWSKYLKCLF